MPLPKDTPAAPVLFHGLEVSAGRFWAVVRNAAASRVVRLVWCEKRNVCIVCIELFFVNGAGGDGRRKL